MHVTRSWYTLALYLISRACRSRFSNQSKNIAKQNQSNSSLFLTLIVKLQKCFITIGVLKQIANKQMFISRIKKPELGLSRSSNHIFLPIASKASDLFLEITRFFFICQRFSPKLNYTKTRRSKIVSRAVARRAATIVDHLWCAAVLKIACVHANRCMSQRNIMKL